MGRVRRGAVRGWRTLALAGVWVWRTRPGVLMLSYLVLTVVGRGLAGGAGQPPASAGGGVSLLLVAFWCWRVASGGRISRRILFLVTFAAYEPAAVHLAAWWNWPAAGLLAAGAAELAILLSPAVYLRTRLEFVPGSVTVVVPSEAYLRLRPRRWMLGLAALAGLAATLLLLFKVQWLPAPGSHGDYGSWVRGQPLPFVTPFREPLLQRLAAFGQDWVQWSELSFAALYLIILTSESRPEVLPTAAVRRRAGPPDAVAGSSGGVG